MVGQGTTTWGPLSASAAPAPRPTADACGLDQYQMWSTPLATLGQGPDNNCRISAGRFSREYATRCLRIQQGSTPGSALSIGTWSAWNSILLAATDKSGRRMT